MMQTLLFALVSIIGANATMDLTINEAIKLALKSNKDILIEEKKVEISSASILKEWGAFDPLFELSSTYTDAEDPTASTFIQSGSIASQTFNLSSDVGGTLPTGTFYKLFEFDMTRTDTDSPLETLSPNFVTSLSFSIGQELLRDFGIDVNMAQINVARRSKDISIKELEVVISSTVVNVVSEYWTLVSAHKSVELANTALELALDLEHRNKVQVDVGVLAPVTVTQAKAEVAARRFDLITAENELEESEDRLKNLLSIPLTDVVVPIDEPTTAVVNINREEIVKTALEKRPELLQAKLDLQNKSILKKFSRNQRLPKFSVQGKLTLKGLGGDPNPSLVSFGTSGPQSVSDKFTPQSEAFSQLVNRDFVTWQVLGVLSIPLFNNSARAEYRRAVADLDKSTIEYSRLVDQVSLDVNNAIRRVESSLRQIEAAKVSVELAEEVLGNEEEKLKVGMGTTRDVLESQRDLVDARLNLITAVADYNKALIVLDRAKGTILDSWGITIRDDDNKFRKPIMRERLRSAARGR